MTPKADAGEVLRHGELRVLGRIRVASNATYLCESTLNGSNLRCVYKPIAGEQQLWDFPNGTLAGRERAAYLISRQLGWDIVPDTVIRDGPAGPGMVQLWIEQPGVVANRHPADPEAGPALVDLFPAGRLAPGYLPVLRAYDNAGYEVTLAHADDIQLRRMAVFDVLINNADRKGGHVLRSVTGRVYGVDHGICLHAEEKLRTVLWGWSGKPIDDEALDAIDRLAGALDGSLADALAELITGTEATALGWRVRGMLDNPVMPIPSRHRPIPWPAF
ncbi:MAG: SCO1664 family protein [Mycobacteriaceae bacterium]|nr:SCO1664 family protein [Mycobacteriaceae bacterium]